MCSCYIWVFISTLSPRSLIWSSSSSSLVIIPSSVFLFISDIVFFVYSLFLIIVSISFFILLKFPLSSFSLSVSSLSFLIDILLTSISDSLLSPFHLALLQGTLLFLSLMCSFFISPFRGLLFVCLFLQFWMLCYACFIFRVNFGGSSSVGLSGVVPFISLSGCSSGALFYIFVGSLVVLGLYVLVTPLLVGSSFQRVYRYSQLPHYLVCYCTGVS